MHEIRETSVRQILNEKIFKKVDQMVYNKKENVKVFLFIEIFEYILFL